LNLQDYVEVSPNKAYVPNLDPKLDPKLGPDEKGSNIVIVDPQRPPSQARSTSCPRWQARIPILSPSHRAVVVGKRLYVLLSAYRSTSPHRPSLAS